MFSSKKLFAIVAAAALVAVIGGCNVGNEPMSRQDVKTMAGGGQRTEADNKLIADKIAAFYKMHPEFKRGNQAPGGAAGAGPATAAQ